MAVSLTSMTACSRMALRAGRQRRRGPKVGGGGVVGEHEVEEGVASEVGNKAATRFEVGDEVVASSGAGVKDDMRWQCPG
jgi:hypothetical protein